MLAVPHVAALGSQPAAVTTRATSLQPHPLMAPVLPVQRLQRAAPCLAAPYLVAVSDQRHRSSDHGARWAAQAPLAGQPWEAAARGARSRPHACRVVHVPSQAAPGLALRRVRRQLWARVGAPAWRLAAPAVAPWPGPWGALVGRQGAEQRGRLVVAEAVGRQVGVERGRTWC